MGIERFEQLDVWQEAHKLVLLVYKNTASFPSDEKFGLVVQMRRSAVSVPANIAEGFKRRGIADKARFYNIAQASLEELRYYFILCHDLEYAIDYNNFYLKSEQIGKMLNALIKSISK
ncbi:MAG: four helix bundle protein [Stigonema ocellatum SAG 48.90 = DSM 106950]|nr:four helix bundle protein [Stigonema ocellatum SAG 48.90 = DSM 106950]